jgi:molybdopterin converting factor small subunit
MGVTITIPAPLRDLARGRSEVAAEGATVGEVLRQVARDHPRLGERLLDEGGRVRRHVGVFLGEVELRELNGLSTPVRDGDRIWLVPAIAGGAPELDGERIARWARQLLVPGFGAAGQERLMAARVRVVGAEGPATPALVALAQAGVGTIPRPSSRATWRAGSTFRRRSGSRGRGSRRRRSAGSPASSRRRHTRPAARPRRRWSAPPRRR